MATTTPNFGWTVPTSSDLVKNGAVAIETLGDSIDASLVDLKGGTTDQVLAKNSNTDMDFKWVSDATGMTNPMTTTGDVIYSSSGSTPARLGLGTAGQVLQVNSGATAPEWATPSGASFGTWAAYTPTWSNLTVGNGTVVARYVQNGKVVNFYVDLTWGSTTSASGSWTLSNWPVAPASNDAARGALVNVWINDVSFGDFLGITRSHVNTTSELRVGSGEVISAKVAAVQFTATAPMTWVSTDRVLISGSYEVA
jgi:hypothetical protein